MLKHRFHKAATFDEYIRDAEKNQDLWTAIRRRATVADELVRRAEALEGRWHLLVLSEDWCGDAFNTVPVVAALADAAHNLDLRLLARDRNPDLMDSHLTGSSRSIPVVMVLDDDYEEQGWWGPRPRELQAWMLSEGMQMAPADRYREARRWYARDGGRTTLKEVLAVLEAAAARRATPVA